MRCRRKKFLLDAKPVLQPFEHAIEAFHERHDLGWNAIDLQPGTGWTSGNRRCGSRHISQWLGRAARYRRCGKRFLDPGQARGTSQRSCAGRRPRSAAREARHVAAYQKGVVSLIEVLQADENLLRASDARAQAQTESARAAVTAFKALGVAGNQAEPTRLQPDRCRPRTTLCKHLNWGNQNE